MSDEKAAVWTGWRTSPLCGFDTETDGTDPESAHIITATVGIVQGQEGWQPRNWLLKTDQPIPPAASAIHGISTEQANQEGRDRAEAIAEIAGMVKAAWMAGSAVVAFNASFDLTILDREMRRLGIGRLALDGMVIDPFVIDKAIDPFRRGSRKLVDVCAHYGIRLDNAHDAGADALAAARLAWKLAPHLPMKRGDQRTSIALGIEQQQDWHRGQKLDLADYFRTKRGDPDTAADIESHLDWPIWPATTQEETAA